MLYPHCGRKISQDLDDLSRNVINKKYKIFVINDKTFYFVLDLYLDIGMCAN